MKKILISIIMALTVIASAAAQQMNSASLAEDTPVKIEINKDDANPKMYALVKGKTVKLGKISDGSEVILPAGTSRIMVGKDSNQFKCTDLRIDDTLLVEVKNPTLSGLGMGITYAGSMILGVGLGLCMVTAMDGNSSDAADFALKVVLPGVAVTASGFGLNLAFRTTITKK